MTDPAASRGSVLVRLAREPLVHFLLLGGLLFLVYARIDLDEAPAIEEIVIDEDRLAMLVTRYERTWQRKPTDAELVAVIDAWVREEVLYREGLALGLDRGDPVVRQRIAQKMDFISEGVVQPPDDEALEAWLTENAEGYRRPPQFAFEQVFVNPERRGEDALPFAEAQLETLRSGSGTANQVSGDPTLLPLVIPLSGEDQILRTFGNEFAGQLGDLPVGEWAGPVSSAFGLHLVRVTQAEPSRIPPLAEIREPVMRDWLSAETEAVQESLYRAMRDRYSVRLAFDRAEAGAESPP